MPLITKLFPARERASEQPESRSLTANPEGKYDQHQNFQAGDEDEMDDGSILNRPRPVKTSSTIPALPPKSELRASRIYENLSEGLKTLESAVLSYNLKEPSPESDPYASYVSSEEDASESADEFDDSTVELDSDGPSSSRASSRCSHEDTARIVSFMFFGKPHLVDVAPQSRPSSLKRKSPETRQETRRRPSPIRLESARTTSSTISTQTSSQASFSITQPGSQATEMSSTGSIAGDVSKGSSLKSYPFPTPEAQDFQVTSTSFETIPETTASSTSTGWKSGFKGVTRTLSKATRKRPSMPKLSLAYTPGVVPRQAIGSPSSVYSTTDPSPPPTRAGQEQRRVASQDISRNGGMDALPSPKPLMRTGSNLFGLGRRKSVKR